MNSSVANPSSLEIERIAHQILENLLQAQRVSLVALVHGTQPFPLQFQARGDGAFGEEPQ
jgi:hypothetical protein